MAKVYPSFPGQPLPGRVGRPLSAEQSQHVKEVYAELIGQKHEIRESEELSMIKEDAARQLGG